MIKLEVVQAEVLERLERLVTEPNFFPGWAASRGVAIYSQGQMNRWMTEGASEGESWEPLNTSYQKKKITKFREYFGQGTKTLIGTSRMLASVLHPSYRDGPEALHGEEYRQVIDDRSLEITTVVPYAQFVDEQRKFMIWSEGEGTTAFNLREDYKKYLLETIRGGN